MILNTNEGDFLVSPHAEARMMLRRITKFETEQVINEGRLEYTESGDDLYRYIIDKREIGVVIVHNARVKTVFIID